MGVAGIGAANFERKFLWINWLRKLGHSRESDFLLTIIFWQIFGFFGAEDLWQNHHLFRQLATAHRTYASIASWLIGVSNEGAGFAVNVRLSIFKKRASTIHRARRQIGEHPTGAVGLSIDHN
ncbi:hypothetical protein D3C86_1618870 [compost metagenome]